MALLPQILSNIVTSGMDQNIIWNALHKVITRRTSVSCLFSARIDSPRRDVSWDGWRMALALRGTTVDGRAYLLYVISQQTSSDAMNTRINLGEMEARRTLIQKCRVYSVTHVIWQQCLPHLSIWETIDSSGGCQVLEESIDLPKFSMV